MRSKTIVRSLFKYSLLNIFMSTTPSDINIYHSHHPSFIGVYIFRCNITAFTRLRAEHSLLPDLTHYTFHHTYLLYALKILRKSSVTSFTSSITVLLFYLVGISFFYTYILWVIIILTQISYPTHIPLSFLVQLLILFILLVF